MTSMMSAAVVTSLCSTASSAISGIGRAEVVCCPEAVWLRHPHRPPTRQALTPKTPQGRRWILRRIQRLRRSGQWRDAAGAVSCERSGVSLCGRLTAPSLQCRLRRDTQRSQGSWIGSIVRVAIRKIVLEVVVSASLLLRAACCAPGSWHVTTRACGGRQREPAWYCSYRVRCS